jgi:hypothetical protein
MDIHGHEVHFGDHFTAREFLKHPENKHVAMSYLEHAGEHGKADFFAEGKRYQIISKDTENGKKEFSVHEFHH